MSIVAEPKTRPTYGDLRTRAQEIADEELKRRILNGLQLLQEKFGEEWVDHINTETLDLAVADRCVLGQLYGNFRDGERAVGFDVEAWSVPVRGVAVYKEPYEHGFWGHPDDNYEGERRAWAWSKLTEAWKLVLAP